MAGWCLLDGVLETASIAERFSGQYPSLVKLAFTIYRSSKQLVKLEFFKLELELRYASICWMAGRCLLCHVYF